MTIENAALAFANAYFEEDSLDNAQKFLKNFYRLLLVQPLIEFVSDFDADNSSFKPSI